MKPHPAKASVYSTYVILLFEQRLNAHLRGAAEVFFRLAGKAPPTLEELRKKARYQPANGRACLCRANPEEIVNRFLEGPRLKPHPAKASVYSTYVILLFEQRLNIGFPPVTFSDFCSRQKGASPRTDLGVLYGQPSVGRHPYLGLTHIRLTTITCLISITPKADSGLARQLIGRGGVYASSPGSNPD